MSWIKSNRYLIYLYALVLAVVPASIVVAVDRPPTKVLQTSSEVLVTLPKRPTIADVKHVFSNVKVLDTGIGTIGDGRYVCRITSDKGSPRDATKTGVIVQWCIRINAKKGRVKA